MELFLDALSGVLTFRVAFLLFIGTLIGILVGALPGINAPTGIALAVPMTFSVPPAEGLILLGTIYAASIYGGSISAILMNVPGEPADVATMFDGPPMAKKGEPQRALELAAISSSFGGLVGVSALLFLSPPLAKVALMFGPAEMFWLAVFGVMVIAAISKENIWNALIGGFAGMLAATIGVNSATGTVRFTFGSEYLVSGVDIAAALIGLFALAEMLAVMERSMAGPSETVRLTVRRGAFWRHLREFTSYPFAYIASSSIGVVVGIIPAAGHSIGALISYGEVKRRSRNREEFGRGAPDGIIASSTAKNAVVGGALIPLLSLGVPGSPAAAVLLGGLTIHGLFPGQGLFTTHSSTIYTFLVGLLVAQVVMLAVGVAGSRFWGNMTRIPDHFLAPAIISLCVVGAYATRNNPADLLMMTGIGLAMYGGSKLGFEPAPIVIGLVLGEMAEQGFLLARTLGDAEDGVWEYFLLRPVSMVIIALTILSLTFGVGSHLRQRVSRPAAKTAEANGVTGRIRRYQVRLAVGVLVVVFSAWARWHLQQLKADDAVFPSVLLWLLTAAGAVMVAQELIRWRYRDRAVAFGTVSQTASIIVILTLVYIAAVLTVGYYASTVVYLLAIAAIVGRRGLRWWIGRALPFAVGLTVLLYWLFYYLLDVRMPSPLLF